MSQHLQLLGRIMLAAIFVMAGFGKIFDLQGTMGYMNAMGIPGILVYPTIALEVLGGLAIIFNYQTKYAALALAGFCILTAALFHNNLADKMQMILFMKNISMAGGLLLLSTYTNK